MYISYYIMKQDRIYKIRMKHKCYLQCLDIKNIKIQK